MAPGTVARAYREAADRVRAARGRGTVVAGPGAVPTPHEHLHAAARTHPATARALGVGPQQALDAVRAAAHLTE